MKHIYLGMLGVLPLLVGLSACSQEKAENPSTKPAAAQKGPAVKKRLLAKAGPAKRPVKVRRVDATGSMAASPANVVAAGLFFKDCQALGAVGALKKYSQGVTVRGPLMRSGTGVMGDYQLSLDVGQGSWPTGKWILATFADKGKAAKAKAPKKGAPITVKCLLSSLSPKTVTLKDCTLIPAR